jgi:hypothetical protein
MTSRFMKGGSAAELPISRHIVRSCKMAAAAAVPATSGGVMAFSMIRMSLVGHVS